MFAHNGEILRQTRRLCRENCGSSNLYPRFPHDVSQRQEMPMRRQELLIDRNSGNQKKYVNHSKFTYFAANGESNLNSASQEIAGEFGTFTS